MRVPFIDLHRPIANEWSALQKAQRRPIDRGVFLEGPEVAAFERDLAVWCGIKHVVAVGSGTDALAIAIEACAPEGSRDSADPPAVLIPAHGFVATATATLQTASQPAFCDVAPDGLAGPDEFVAAGEAMLSLPFVAVPVHLYGRRADVAGIRAAMRERWQWCAIVEDACQAIGLAGLGSSSDAACLSFYPTKNLGAWGDGGAILTQRDDIAEAARALRRYGAVGDDWAIPRTAGWCSRMDEQQAAVLQGKLRLMDRWRRQREHAWATYVAELPAELLPWGEGGDRDWNHHLVPVLLPEGVDRSQIRSTLSASGIGTGVHYAQTIPAALRQQPKPEWYPNATQWAARELSLPMFPGIRDSEVALVCRELERALHEVAT